MRLREPIEIPKGRKLRILLYARYSTDEQNPLSIEDQYASAMRLVATFGISDFEVERICDEGISGELLDRPGINQVREGVCKRNWDLIIGEESSRLFRNPAGCLIFVQCAVDHGIRVICINDFIDTADEDWQEILLEAQRHHTKSNKFTRKRIERAYLSRWESGAAVTWLRSGYKRRATFPGTDLEPVRGPFFDEVDSTWAPIVAEAFKRLAEQVEPWLVVKFLNESKLPACEGSGALEWDERMLFARVRNPIYRGVEEGGKTITTRKYAGAKPRRETNRPENVRTRQMPHLRIVSDEIWYRANAYIDSRTRKPQFQRDGEHPLKGIARDSRQPLSEIFVCGICGRKMWGDGRNEGGYRCSGAKSKLCWNRATCLRALSHQQIGKAIIQQLFEDRAILQAEIEAITTLVTSDESLAAKIRELQSNVASLSRRKARLDEAIEHSDETVESLMYRRNELESQLRLANFELAELGATSQERRDAPSSIAVLQAMEAMASQFLTLDREIAAILKQLLVGPIKAVPFQQFGSNKIVLRARFSLRYFNLVPFELRRLIASDQISVGMPPITEREMLVDLFSPPNPIKHFNRCWNYVQANPKSTLDEVAADLLIPRHIIHRSLQLGRQLAAANVSDPFLEVLEQPAAASRWKFGLRSAG